MLFRSDNTGLHQPCVFYDVPVMEKSCSLLEKEKPDIPGYQAELIEKYKGSDIVFYMSFSVLKVDL